MSWGNWSATWSWVERAVAYDAAIEREKLDAFKAEQVEAARRHARVLQAAISAVSVPLRIALEVSTPEGLLALKTAASASTSGLRAALDAARLSAAAIPALVQAERLTMGMTTERLEVDTPTVDVIAQRIVADPKATELAVELLDRVSKQASDSSGEV